MHPMWAQRREEVLRDCIVSPDGTNDDEQEGTPGALWGQRVLACLQRAGAG
jgi:hypothetical protein